MNEVTIKILLKGFLYFLVQNHYMKEGYAPNTIINQYLKQLNISSKIVEDMYKKGGDVE